MWWAGHFSIFLLVQLISGTRQSGSSYSIDWSPLKYINRKFLVTQYIFIYCIELTELILTNAIYDLGCGDFCDGWTWCFLHHHRGDDTWGRHPVREVRHVVCGMGLCQREGLAQLHSNQQVCLVQIFFITARETWISLLLKAN